MKIHTALLMEQQGAYIDLSDEAIDYLASNLDLDNVDGIRHVMRHLYAADQRHRSDAGQAAVRNALLYALNCVDPQRLNGLIEDPYDPIPRPRREMRRFFEWWWDALFGDESFDAPDICSAEVAEFMAPLGAAGDTESRREVSYDVLLFPRTDGLPPGHGAPPPERLYRYDAPPVPRRPTDGARFFRWKDQADAIKQAKKVHRRTGQWKVWVGFEWPIGEGYVTGGPTPEYRRTAWACVRLSGGNAVDSFPDLRKGGPVDPNAP